MYNSLRRRMLAIPLGCTANGSMKTEEPWQPRVNGLNGFKARSIVHENWRGRPRVREGRLKLCRPSRAIDGTYGSLRLRSLKTSCQEDPLLLGGPLPPQSWGSAAAAMHCPTRLKCSSGWWNLMVHAKSGNSAAKTSLAFSSMIWPPAPDETRPSTKACSMV